MARKKKNGQNLKTYEEYQENWNQRNLKSYDDYWSALGEREKQKKEQQRRLQQFTAEGQAKLKQSAKNVASRTTVQTPTAKKANITGALQGAAQRNAGSIVTGPAMNPARPRMQAAASVAAKAPTKEEENLIRWDNFIRTGSASGKPGATQAEAAARTNAGNAADILRRGILNAGQAGEVENRTPVNIRMPEAQGVSAPKDAPPKRNRMLTNSQVRSIVPGVQMISEDPSFEAFQARNGVVKPDESKSTVEQLQDKYWVKIPQVKKDELERIAFGAYNGGTNPTLWNDEQLNIPTTKYAEIAEEKAKKGQEAIDKFWNLNTDEYADAVFDFTEKWKQTNEETILNGSGYTTDEKANAANTIVELQNTLEERKAESKFKIGEYYQFGFNVNSDDQEELRRDAFEFITGESYDEWQEKMNPADQKQLNVLLDEVVDNAKARTEYSEDEMRLEYTAAYDVAEAYREMIPAALEEQRIRGLQKDYEKWAMNTGHSPTYDPSLHPEPVWTTNTEGDRIVQPQGTDLDKIYYWMNNPDAMGGMENSLKYARAEYFVPDEQREMFNRMYADYKKNGTPIAREYWKGLEPMMDFMLGQYQKRVNQMTAEIPGVGAAARLAGYPMQVIGGAMGMVGAALNNFEVKEGSLADKLGMKGLIDSAKKSTSPWYIPSTSVRDTRQQQNTTIAKRIEEMTGGAVSSKAGNFLMNVADSMIDNIMAMGVARTLTNNQITDRTMDYIQVIMSGEATSNAMVTQLENGKNAYEAAAYAIGIGLIEGATERWSLEQIIRPDVRSIMKSGLKKAAFVGKSFAAEGSEEVAADVGEILMDNLFGIFHSGEDSEKRKTAETYARTGADSLLTIADKYRTELDRRYNAKVRANIAAGMDNKEATRTASREVLAEKAEEIGQSFLAGGLSGGLLGAGRLVTTAADVRTEGKTIEDRGRVKELIEVGLGTEKSSEGYALARELQEKMNNGEQITEKEIGKLKFTLQADASDVLGNARGAETQLPRVKKSAGVLDSVSAIAGESAGARGTDAGMKMASLEDENTAEGTKVAGARGIIHYGKDSSKFGRMIGIRNVEETVKDKNGKETKRNALKYVIEIDGKEIEVDPGTVQSTDYRTAVLMNRITENPGLYSEKFVKTVLQEMDAEDSGTVLAPLAESIRIAAYTGAELPTMSLPQDVAVRLYKASREEYAEFRDREVRGSRKAAGTGSAIYKGLKYGTAEYQAKVKEDGLSRETRDKMGIAAELAKRIGTDIWLADEADLREERKKGTLKYGGRLAGLWGIENYATDGFNGIVLNIEGKKLGTKGFYDKHNILVTFGHEFTHWLQRNSRQGYDNLEKFVLDEQRKALGGQGQLAAELTRIMQDQGVDLANAISELVADSCDQILSNEKVIRHIQETNKTLYGEIRDFAKDLYVRIRNAIAEMTGSASNAARRMMQADMDRMAELFNFAWDEATGKVVDAAETEGAESTARMSAAYDQAVKDGDVETQQRLVDEAAKQAGYTIKGYHGSNADFTQFKGGNRGEMWFGDRPETAYKRKNTYATYLKMKNPFEVTYFIGAESKFDPTYVTEEGRQNRHDGAIVHFKLNPDYVKGSIEILSDWGKQLQATDKFGDNFTFLPHGEDRAALAKPGETLVEFMQRGAEETLYNWYVVYNPSQIKSADPVTYDEDGNVIPLSDRFNEGNNDIRYSTAEHKKTFAEQIDDFMDPNVDNNKTFGENSLIVGKAPTIFRLIGLPQLPVVINQEHVGYALFGTYENEKFREGHEFSPEEFKKLPEKIAHPIAIGYDPSSAKDVIIYVDMINKTGNQVIVPLRIGGKGSVNNQRIDALKIDTVYARENGRKMLESTIQKNSKENPTLFYIDKEKAAGSWLGYDTKTIVRGLDTGLIHRITDANSPVKIGIKDQTDSMQFKRWFGKSKVVNDDGTPMIVYHGTSELFDAFDMSKGRTTMDIQGAFFSPWEIDAEGYGEHVGAYYLSIQNPADEKTAYAALNRFKGQNNAGIKAKNYLISLGYDGVINGVEGQPEEFIAFWPTQIKSATDNIGTFDRTDPEYRYSAAQEEEIREAEENGIGIDVENGSAYRFSRASWERSEYFRDPEKMARILAKNVLKSESKENVSKAERWIKAITGVAAMIGDRAAVLDYVASPGRSSFKSNPEYGGSIDSSTICAKRRLQTGTIDAIQKAMPDYVMTAEDFLQIRRMMKERGYEVSCGLCFVESSRKNIAKYASQFMNEWNSQHPENRVNMTQINTVLGLEETRLKNKEVYDAYEKFMNKLAQRKPKLFEMRSEYNNDILKHFRNDASITEKNRNGGMRINSFSDFEIVHLIDMMQVIMDMSNVGLAGQAYTKVRQFAEALGPTGLKINMSMIAQGVDADGRIIFDEVEGMKWSDVEDLRNLYPDNVGTVCVIFTEEQLMAAMADDRIDFIIPFHRSQWNKSNYRDIGLPENTKDFTYWQNERYAKPVYGVKKDGSPKKLRATNYMPNDYWDFGLSGKENAEAYLRKCAAENKIPKFWRWLQNNGDGSFSLKEDGSTDGYWKLLIDFKMYNHLTGAGVEQKAVQPVFDMEASERMLREYKGGHTEFPVADDVVRDFVNEKRKGRKGLKTGEGGRIQLAGNEVARMSHATEDSLDVEAWMEARTPGSFRTEDERIMWQAWKKLRNDARAVRFRVEEYQKQIRQLEEKGVDNLSWDDREKLKALRNKMSVKQAQLDRIEAELRKTTGTTGFATMMREAQMTVSDFMAGKSQAQVQAAVDSMTGAVEQAEKEIARQEKELQKLGQESAVKTVRTVLRNRGLARTVDALRSQYSTSMSRNELESRMAEIILKSVKGEDVTEDIEALAADVAGNQVGYGAVEAEEALGALRGRTIVIGPGQQAELKANHLTLKDIRQRTKGSGIKFVFGETSTLDTDADELVAEVPALQGMLDNEKASLENFVGYVESLLALKQGNAAENGVDPAEVESFIGAMAQVMLNEEIGGMSKADLIAKIRADAGRIGTALNAVRKIREGLQGVREKGQKAQTWTEVLAQDMDTVLDYYDKVARMAARQERTTVRKALIEQLKGENTRKLMEQREKYETMMKNDREARQIAADNQLLRSKINTAVKRISRLMTEETDLKNVPEQAKPLARWLVRMFVENDSEYRHVLMNTKSDLENAMRHINAWQMTYGNFDPNTDLDWLLEDSEGEVDTEIYEKVQQAMADIRDGLQAYRTAEGRGVESIRERKAALTKVQEGVATIYNVIQAQRTVEINGRRVEIVKLASQAQKDMANSRFRGEWTGRVGRRLGAVRSFVGYGNMTPVYFFKNLRNGTLRQLFAEYERAENRNGLEVAKARAALARIAEETGYSTWDQERRYTIKLAKGDTVELTLGEMMSLYATWAREVNNQLLVNGAEKSFHLTQGGFVTEPDTRQGFARRERQSQKPHRLVEEDIAQIKALMTPEQLQYVEKVVKYMTQDIGELGNEASMKMYGIRKFTEKWYFPFEVWHGVLSSKSNVGAQQSTQNRIAHGSQTKRRKNNAKNALIIRDFTQTAVRHIAAQINYNTFAPAIEWMQRVMNTTFTEGTDATNMVDRNLWAAFRETYGRDAEMYLKNFQRDINGGTTQEQKTPVDRLISTFRKSAVAGSLSVALQQPLSYFRAAMEISPRWLTEALNPVYYRGSAAEMEAHSGVAVLKMMGKFDMGMGESAAQYMAPEARQRRGRRIYEWASDRSTMLPEAMDRMTWTRIWTACKLEQAHEHPEMDQNSDEFMELVTNRFNDVLRLTQVYDSTLVRSQSMRSKNPFMKQLTSFMAEPTLSANVLVDSIINRDQDGGAARIARAGATYALSAVMQAVFKGLMSAGRNPDEKKTMAENVAYRFMYNFISEINPFSLIPGYSDMITLLKKGEISDDAMGMIGKLFAAGKTGIDLISGKSDDVYRGIEDSAGVIAQLFSNIPVKNIARDMRAMYNFITQPYAKRETSAGVLRYQVTDQIMTADNLLGAINELSGQQIWGTRTGDYEQRIYDAKKAGDENAAQEMTDYYTLAKSKAADPEKTLQQALNAIAKKDESISAAETVQFMMEGDSSDKGMNSYVIQQLKAGTMTAEEGRKALAEIYPDKDENEIWWKVDRAVYQAETGNAAGGNEQYYRLYDAVDSNKSEQINRTISDMLEHGMTEKQIKDNLPKMYKSKYLEATAEEKVRIKNALEIAYKALGYTKQDADKAIDGWKKK